MAVLLLACGQGPTADVPEGSHPNAVSSSGSPAGSTTAPQTSSLATGGETQHTPPSAASAPSSRPDSSVGDDQTTMPAPRRRGPRPPRVAEEPDALLAPGDLPDPPPPAEALDPGDGLIDLPSDLARPEPPSELGSTDEAPVSDPNPPSSTPSSTRPPPSASSDRTPVSSTDPPPTGTDPTPSDDTTDLPPSSEQTPSGTSAASDEPPETSALPTSTPSASEENRGHDVQFQRWEDTGLDALTYFPFQGAPGAYGAGAALVDFTGDGKLDLFLGAGSRDLHEACLYRNVSTPDQVRFEPLPEACTGLGPMLGGLALPRPGRPGDDLLLFGENAALRLSLGPDGTIRVDPLYQITTDPGSLEGTCVALAALLVDLTLDGTAEIIVACGAGLHTFDRNDDLHARNRILRIGPDGLPALLPPDTLTQVEDGGATLALAWIDLERDGLPDLMIVNDTFSTVNMRNLRYPTGTVQRRCAPEESCALQPLYFAPDPSAWGSFMGVGEALVGDHRRWYVTDWGPNRLLRWDGERLVDDARSLGVRLGQSDGYFLFAWSAIVDDFNGNGLDDILVTQGSPNRSSTEEDLLHRNLLLLQVEPSVFERLGEEVGLPTSSFEGSQHDSLPTSSRGAMKADLNLDGRLDLIVLDFRAPPRILREVVPPERPLRCNVDPVSRLVPTVGAGFAFARDHGRTFRTWDIQGQMLFGAPPRLLLPLQRGVLRFPSGAEIPFDCENTPGPIEVHEPDWLHIAPEETQVSVRAAAPWLFAGTTTVPVTLAYLRDDPVDPLALDAVHLETTDLTRAALEAGWTAPRPPDANADTVMVRFGDRWVPRRFPLR